MRAFYQIVLPVRLSFELWRDINPYANQWVDELRLMLRQPGQKQYRQGMLSFDGMEEWSISRGLLDFSDSSVSVPLVWGEDDLIRQHKNIKHPNGS